MATVLIVAWLLLGRWIERYTSRDFFRAMLEHISYDDSDKPLLSKVGSRIALWFQRKWDAVCPLFLQRLVFSPHWNRRTQKDLLNHIAFWRSRDRREHRYATVKAAPVEAARLSILNNVFLLSHYAFQIHFRSLERTRVDVS